MHPIAECGVKEKGGTWTQSDRVQVLAPHRCLPLGTSLHLSELPLLHLGLGESWKMSSALRHRTTMIASPGGGVTVQGFPRQPSPHVLPRVNLW